ncbi:chaperonin [Fragilaria crotonensis]|nr:chaperonin [Fragilaria crotonensis]
MVLFRFITFTVLAALLVSDTLALSSNPKPKFFGGAGVGRLTLEDLSSQKIACHYDMVLVERIQGRPKTESGLFVPQEDLPKLHLCKVVSVGPGREEENGMIAPMPDLSVGDIVIAKNPWGIGPKDEETSDGKKFSFMRSQDIAAIVTGGIEEFERDDGQYL